MAFQVLITKKSDLIVPLEVLKWQELSTWFYNSGIGHVQRRFEIPKTIYFAPFWGGKYILAAQFYTRKKPEFHQFKQLESESQKDHEDWFSCSLTSHRIFQLMSNSTESRIVQMYPARKTYSIQPRSQTKQVKKQGPAMVYVERFDQVVIIGGYYRGYLDHVSFHSMPED